MRNYNNVTTTLVLSVNVFYFMILNYLILQAPEEFLDPITDEIMEEPVILPTSGKTMDKSSIIRHLLRFACSSFRELWMCILHTELGDLIKK